MRTSFVVFLVGLLATTGGCGTKAEPAPSPRAPLSPIVHQPTSSIPPSKPSVAERPKPSTTFSGTAEDYIKEWKKDGKAARGKYEGATVEVSGIVAEASPGPGLPTVAFYEADGVTTGITCFTLEPEPWAKIVPGQKVTIKGKQSPVDGPQLDHCQVVNVGPSPAITLTAKELAGQYAKDKSATSSKYKDKYLILTGEVVGKEEDFPYTRVQLKTDGVTKVVFPLSSLRDADNVKTGEQIKVVGKFRYLKNPKDKETALLAPCYLITGAK